MSDPYEPVIELLADRAIFGLSAEEQRELDKLLAACPLPEIEALELLAAEIARTSVPANAPQMPVELQNRIMHDAPRHLIPTIRRNTPRSRKVRLFVEGFFVAASVLLAVGIWWKTQSAPVLTPSEKRLQLLSRLGQPQSDVIQLQWTAGNDPAARGAGGEVVWSTSAQEGYMLFRGLAANNPKVEQYQLWIFDAERDQRFPVDGGVFDVPANGGDVIIPIQLKLHVTRPVLFAVTVEPPGGVVVSSRARLPLSAQVPGKDAG